MRVLIVCILGVLFLTEVTCFVRNAKLHQNIQKREAGMGSIKIPDMRKIMHTNVLAKQKRSVDIHTDLRKVHQKLAEVIDKYSPIKKRSSDDSPLFRKLRKHGARPGKLI